MTNQEIIEAIESMTLLQVKELVDELKEKFGVTGEQYLTGQGGFLFTKLFVNDELDQTGFISSAELTDAANDKYLEYAAELEITIERRIVWDDPYFEKQAPAKEYVEWWEQPTITPVEL